MIPGTTEESTKKVWSMNDDCCFCGFQKKECFRTEANDFQDEPTICKDCVKQLYILNKGTLALDDLKQ